ncbi:MAG: hypothetical protein IT207_05440 [Fimbriimonadaceae bacterium]|nr:hypothetical protein [Fimbriimonadaceae bacterium]
MPLLLAGNALFFQGDAVRHFEAVRSHTTCRSGNSKTVSAAEFRRDLTAVLDGTYHPQEMPAGSNPCVDGGCEEHHWDVRDTCKKDSGDLCGGFWWQNEWVYRQTRIYYQCPSSGGWVWRVACLDWNRTGDCCRTSNTQFPGCTGNQGEPSCDVPWPPL